MISLREKKKKKRDQYPNILSLSKMLPKKKIFSCSIYSMVVLLYDSICSTLYVICFDPFSFSILLLLHFHYFFFFLSSTGKCTSIVDPYDHYYICRSFYVDINFLSLDLIHILHPKHVVILINLLQK